MGSEQDRQQGEREHHEELYSGFAQEHFAKPAVRAFRRHLVGHILRVTGASSASRVLSLGCGIGDTELLLAPAVAGIVGADLSGAAIRQARADAARAGVGNVEFLQGDLESLALPEHSFEVVIAIFFLHHLPDQELDALAGRLRALLAPGGVFYSLDPSRYRLTGALGRLLVPHLMKKYQSPGERELAPGAVGALLAAHGFAARWRMYDFVSTPLAGLFPSARRAYLAARAVDEALIRTPLVAGLASNFEVLARVR